MKMSTITYLFVGGRVGGVGNNMGGWWGRGGGGGIENQSIHRLKTKNYNREIGKRIQKTELCPHPYNQAGENSEIAQHWTYFCKIAKLGKYADIGIFYISFFYLVSNRDRIPLIIPNFMLFYSFYVRKCTLLYVFQKNC